MIITSEKDLRVKCSDVLPEEIPSIKEALEKALKHSYEMGRPGMGLAAPQIGIAKNMAIVRLSGQASVCNIDLINCRIEQMFDEFIFEGEGCLSFPNLSIKTKRYNEIVVVDNYSKPHRFIATGLLSVCIQHELDHLQGILFVDRWIE